jgi:hypothetical protein
MTANDFRRLALSLEGIQEGSHYGHADFRFGGRIFATLAAEKPGYGNLMLTPEQQAAFVMDAPKIFLPIPGGWGRNGATHVRLAAVNEDTLLGALRTAWKLRVELNAKSRKRSAASPIETLPATPSKNNWNSVAVLRISGGIGGRNEGWGSWVG